MGVHSFEKLGAKMGAHSFFWQRVRVVRHTKNMGAINSLIFFLRLVPDLDAGRRLVVSDNTFV